MMAVKVRILHRQASNIWAVLVTTTNISYGSLPGINYQKSLNDTSNSIKTENGIIWYNAYIHTLGRGIKEKKRKKVP